MTLALREEEFRNFRTIIVRSHLQLPGTHDCEALIVPYLAKLVICKKDHSLRSHRRLLLC